MKDATVSARVELDVKEGAEGILQRLGIPVSVAINSFYRQIIFHGGLPFTLTLPKEPRTADDMPAEELNAMLAHSYEQSLAGEGRPLDEAFDDLEEELA